MEHAKVAIEGALSQAGQPTSVTPELLRLEKLRITPEKELPPMDFLFRLFGKPCFPRRELVAITGKAKSGKTFVTSMLMARGASPLPPPNGGGELMRNGTDPLKILWYDTEQSDESTQDILKNRVFRMVTPAPDLFSQRSGELFDVFNVRAVEWKERRSLLKEAVEWYRPDLVIVDGIRDLVNDINDGVLAQEVMEELLHLATACNCCIVCVLHQNKGSEDHNLRGWIGTELMNKAFEVYACEKLMPQRIFKVEQTLTRKYDIEQTMYFEVGDDGLPRTAPCPIEGEEKRHEERLPQLNSEYIVHDDSVVDGWQIDVARLFLDAMHGREEIGGAELRTEVCRLANITQFRFYNKLLQRAQDEKVIVKVEHDRRTFYQPAPF